MSGESSYLAGWQLTAAGDFDFSGAVFEHKASLSGTLPQQRSPSCSVATYAKLSWMTDQMKLGRAVTVGAPGCAARHRL